MNYFIRGNSEMCLTSTLTEDVRRASAFVPGHITGMFRIFDTYEDPLRRGSTGAGFAVTAGTHTEIKLVPSSTLEIEVEYNNKRIDAPVTQAVIRLMANDSGEQFKAFVQHDSSLPIGVGFGASGAGALGCALALGQVLNDPIGPDLAARFAHVAEVTNQTGLGDVIAQTVGGVEIRMKSGGPGFGEILNVPLSQSDTVILAGSPGLETREVLTDPVWRSRINQAGDHHIQDLLSDPTFEAFISCSRAFAEEIDLMPERVQIALHDLDAHSLTQSSMVMLGDSVYCFCEDSQKNTAIEVLTRHWKESDVLVTSVSSIGGRVV